MHHNMHELFHQNITLLQLIDKAVFHFRTQNFDLALRLVTVILDQLSSWLDKVIAQSDYFNKNQAVVEVNYLVSILDSLLQAQENKDYILLGDIYESQLIPILHNLQLVIMDTEGFILDQKEYSTNVEVLKAQNIPLKKYYKSIEELLEHIEEGYSVEYTSRGQYTLAMVKEGKKFYFHSNYCVTKEAFQLANSWYVQDKTNYIIYGLGLGYHVNELLEIDKNITIEVYESDMNTIQLACAFSNIGQVLLCPNVTLIYDPEFIKLSERMEELSSIDEFVIHYPSLRNIKSTPVKEKLENYFVQYSSIKNQLRLLNGNFKKNINYYSGLVDELKHLFRDKDLYIIAAGPSLDKNYLQLKELNKNSIILATGTVLKKLLNAGIRPDYFIVTDANERVYAQISGLENENIPMLYLSTAYHGFAENYQGGKYMILQKDYEKSEQYAKEKGVSLYRTGGSVSTTALDIGISLGCKRIIFLGLDLAFTNNYVHALGTSRRELSSTDDLRQVEDINGDLIYTSKSLDIYREWIEDRIIGIKNIEFIDATEGGTKIKGMQIAKIIDVINKGNS